MHPATVVCFGTAAILLARHHGGLIEEIEAFIDKFTNGGGPRFPMHPSPANDRRLTNRKRKRGARVSYTR